MFYADGSIVKLYFFSAGPFGPSNVDMLIMSFDQSISVSTNLVTNVLPVDLRAKVPYVHVKAAHSLKILSLSNMNG